MLLLGNLKKELLRLRIENQSFLKDCRLLDPFRFKKLKSVKKLSEQIKIKVWFAYLSFVGNFSFPSSKRKK